jgi:hypothetical protein
VECLQSHTLATAVSAGFIILAFSRHVTICSYFTYLQNHYGKTMPRWFWTTVDPQLCCPRSEAIISKSNSFVA